MLKIPFKKAEPVAFQRALKEAIATTFEEDPANYQQDLDALESMRLSVQDPQVHEASLQTHLVYYAQLSFLESKFSISEDGVKLFFTWCNAFGKQDSVSSHNIGFEKASVLFNIGAIYCQLGVSTGSQTEDAIKKSAAYFQKSAGAYKTIIEKLPSWNIQGSANTQLDALSNLMLGQAQEVFLNKAIGSKMKEATLAKLASQANAFYQAAYEVAKETTIFDKPWLAHMNCKQLHFRSVCQYYKSIESELAGKFGEQVGWLAAALAANKQAKDQIYTQKLVVSSFETDIQSFGSMLETQFQRANKDNDKIYMESVPKIADLPPVPPAKMVNPIMIPEVDQIQVPKPVFRALVPFQIHQAASKYDHKKNELVKGVSAKLTEATTLAHTTLLSQKLPGSIEALEQPIGLPKIVLERSQEVKSKGGSRYIENSWATLASLSQTTTRLLQEGFDALDQEEREDDELRRLYGNRWTRAQSSVLTRKLREKGIDYRQKIDSANQSNAIVRSKIDSNLFLIEHLTMDRQELEASIPASTASSTLALKDPNLKLLKGYLDALNKNIKQRPEILSRLKKISEGDDIGPRLTKSALGSLNVDEAAIFAEQLKVYDADIQLINKLIAEQEKLLESIFNTNTAFMNSHQTTDLIRQREGALSNLDIAYRHFKDITGNLEEGIIFFTEIEGIVKKIQGHCFDFVTARNSDRDQLLSQIQSGAPSPMASGNLYNSSSSLPPPSTYQQQFSPSAPQNPQYYPSQQFQGVPGVWNPQQQQQRANLPPQQNPSTQQYPGTYSPNPPPNWQPPKY